MLDSSAPPRTSYQVHQEVLAALAAASTPMTTAELIPHCPSVPDRAAISRAAYDLRTGGHIRIAAERQSHTGRGARAINAYAITAQGLETLETGAGIRGRAATKRAAMAEAPPPRALDDAPSAAHTTGSEGPAAPDPDGATGECPDYSDDLLEAVRDQTATLMVSSRQITIIRVAIHRHAESPIYGETTTWVELDDEGAGGYLRITQPGCDRDERQGPVITLDSEDLPMLLEAARLLGAYPTRRP